MSAGSASHARRLPHPRGEKGAAGLPLICPERGRWRVGGSAPDRVRSRRFPPANAARARNVRVYAHIYLTKPRRGIKLKFVSRRNYGSYSSRKEVAEDPTRTTVLGLSRAGNVEVIRVRKRPSLLDMLSVECESCQGLGRVLK